MAANLGFSVGSSSFRDLAGSDPVELRNRYQVVYIAPGLSSTDYTYLQQMVAPLGFIEQFVSLGGVVVINTAGLLGDQPDIAPGGVDFSGLTQHNSEAIASQEHPYITGLGYGGSTLTDSDFSTWGPVQPTDLGILDLTTLSDTPAVVLQNSNGPSWVEYQHGSGRVIVTTLTYCWAADPSLLSQSQRAATSNLLRYSSFFSGSAFTPAPTVTRTGSPTPTFTPRRTPTPSFTPIRTDTPTPVIPTSTATPAVTLADVIGAIFGDSAPAGADVNQDGEVTAADVPALWLP